MTRSAGHYLHRSMGTYEDKVQHIYDSRMGTLAKIKARSLGADNLVLSALNVLVYAQLEGGVKELAAFVIKSINFRNPQVGELAPCLLSWRNPEEIGHFQRAIDFYSISKEQPFRAELQRPVSLRPINRRYELNQMSWLALQGLYRGLGLSDSEVSQHSADIDSLVDERNQIAHQGIPSELASKLLENQLRASAGIVENVLTDLSLHLLNFFSENKHRRHVADSPS